MADTTLAVGDNAPEQQEQTVRAPEAPLDVRLIGPYHILKLLGEGGMGEVYKAERRAPIRQTVAIKIIKLGFNSREVIARFESERQALARMDHSGVARVLDAGTTDTGRPYFVMEYVPGKPITQFCDDNMLSIKDRLLLFNQACEAITHAHTKAIIHRDIKASNVLAFMHDGNPTVKVIDFGIAKALTGDRLTDATFNTEQGRIVGTYDSMSPEQADSSPDIDTRTDVYSLGVLLYELLAGVKPFDHDAFAKAADQEIRRIIREVEPPRPSTRLTTLGETGTRVAIVRRSRIDALARTLGHELEWIPLKAMRKERARRYSSPLQMSEDIRNYLEGKPLLAGPESRGYRLRKFAGRHRAPIVATAAFTILIAAGIVTYIRGIRAEQQKTQAALNEAANQKAVVVAVNQFLSEMLASADPTKTLGDKVTVLQVTHAALQELDSGKLTEQPLVEAGVRVAIGRTLCELGQYRDATGDLRTAVALRKRELPANHPDIAEALQWLAFGTYAQGDLDKAEQMLREALAIQRASLQPRDPEIATSLNALALILLDQRRLDDAAPLFAEALEIRRSTLPDGHWQIAQSLNNMGLLAQEQGRSSDAEPLYREAIQMWRKAYPGAHPSTASGLTNLARLMMDQGRFADAEPIYREALEMRRKVLPPSHPEIADSFSGLGRTLLGEGKLSEAESSLRDAVAIRKERFGARAAPTTRSAGPLATLLDQTNRHDEAAALRNECGLPNPTTHPIAVTAQPSAR